MEDVRWKIEDGWERKRATLDARPFIVSADSSIFHLPSSIFHLRSLLLLRLRDLALVARGVVRMDQPLPGGTIEQLGRGLLRLGRRTRGLGVLDRGAQCGALRAIAHGGCARLAHVLLG